MPVKVVFKNCAPFTYCITKTNNRQVDNTKNIDVVMSLYNLIGSSGFYSKIPAHSWQDHGMNQLQVVLAVLLIFILVTIVFRLNLREKRTGKTVCDDI